MASYKSKIVTESFVKLHEQQLVYRSDSSPSFVQVFKQKLSQLSFFYHCLPAYCLVYSCSFFTCKLSFSHVVAVLSLFRDVGLVNWDCTLQTAIPDIEVDGTLYFFVIDILILSCNSLSWKMLG